MCLYFYRIMAKLFLRMKDLHTTNRTNSSIAPCQFKFKFELSFDEQENEEEEMKMLEKSPVLDHACDHK